MRRLMRSWVVASIQGKPGEVHVVLRYRTLKRALIAMWRQGQYFSPCSHEELMRRRFGWVIVHESCLLPQPTRFERWLEGMVRDLRWKIAVMELAEARERAQKGLKRVPS